MKSLFALISGILFGVGLIISGMTNPAKVIGFLDVAGHWDPSLALVMAGALGVTFAAFRIALKMSRPVVGESFVAPKKTTIDRRLILGASLFGIGWGLGGFCPGPAIVGLAFGVSKIRLFAMAMIAGMLLFHFMPIRRALD